MNAPLPTPAADAEAPPLPYENRSLFSDPFLAERLSALPEWDEDAGPAWARARALWAERRGGLPGLFAEEAWVRPVLREVLGWELDENLPLGERLPLAERGEASPSAVADAAAWGHPLDVADAAGRIPAFRTVASLAATGAEWGILTDGREWRLYAARARSRLGVFYSVDLPRLLEAGDAGAFRWFWLFFRAGGGGFRDAVLRGSAAHAGELEAALKRLVCEDVFERLARGFVDGRRRRGLADEGEESLREVFAGTLRLLYRLLFVLHAEARGLFPADGPSLRRLLRAVAARVDAGEAPSGASTAAWEELSALFDLLGREGGLFRADDEGGRFLRENPIADSFLVRALDRLARDGEGRFVDYRALGVEQLGSLYEGLLEFRLAPDAQGKPSLVNEKGERRATGSYYTPHWLVEYLVAEAVGPVLAARADAFRAALAAAAEREARLEGAGSGERPLLERELEALGDEAAEALLGIRGCDPAMGSGRFLVHAADWLAERMAVLLDRHPGPGNPLLARLAALRAELAAGAADAAQLGDAVLLKRMVVKRCVFGVDLNPAAAELARLSLWLDAFVPGAPLPFLDHHLRHGNALVGARVEEVQRAIEESPQGQFDAFGGPFRGLLRTAGLMRAVAFRADATADEVAASAGTFAELERELAPYRVLLDVWVSRAFGNRLGEELAGVLGEDVLKAARGRPARLGEAHREALARAEAVGRAHRFFHWELEFPEVFIDLERAAWKDDPGFDAVVGNPPYVRQEQVKGLKPFLAGAYHDVYDGAADLYVYFCRRGLELLRRGGRLAFVLANKWLRAGYGEGLREFLARRGQVERVVDFGHAPVFPDADVFPCLVVVRRPAEEPTGQEEA
ncbi:MAG TPA: Eco57I restriction-modification methylase domain-containing protein, partial [Longimicrobiaceae bacterium]|nr:Eco57I restriction-modification methylase domain-containing protein [Longimicrobiaceae bacterium]